MKIKKNTGVWEIPAGKYEVLLGPSWGELIKAAVAGN